MELRVRKETKKIGEICIPSIIQKSYGPLILVPGKTAKNEHNLDIISPVFLDVKGNPAVYGIWTYNGIVSDQGVYNPEPIFEDIPFLLPAIELEIEKKDAEFGEWIDIQWTREYLKKFRQLKWIFVEKKGAVIYDKCSNSLFILGNPTGNFDRSETIFQPDKRREQSTYICYKINTNTLISDPSRIEACHIPQPILESNIEIICESNESPQMKIMKAVTSYYRNKCNSMIAVNEENELKMEQRISAAFEYAAKCIKATLYRDKSRKSQSSIPYNCSNETWDDIEQYLLKEKKCEKNSGYTKSVPKINVNGDRAYQVLGKNNIEGKDGNHLCVVDDIVVSYRKSSRKVKWTWNVKPFIPNHTHCNCVCHHHS